jgi:hypothetical protein
MPLLFSSVYSPTHLLQLQSLFFLFRVHMGSAPLPLSCGVYHRTATVTSFPCSKVAGQGRHSCFLWPALVYLQFTWGSSPPPHSGAQGILPSLLYVFFFFSLLLIIQFVFFPFFPLVGVQSVQGTVLICSRVLCGSTTCHSFAHLRVCQAG